MTPDRELVVSNALLHGGGIGVAVAAVLVPVDVARRLYREEKPDFAAFLMTFPGGLDDFERDQITTRSIDL